MKIYALYLPQFHSIPENDSWWGKGFTEWENVKNAKPLFAGHLQPKHPLDDNYYNLLDKSTIMWQNETRKKYGIDGFIFYHYYFKGKKLLEKPAENLLNWEDIDLPFFFNWANHTWRRSWNGTREVLLKQEYGDEKDWKDHFNYLRTFFVDSRYIKIDNKPVLMIYDPLFKDKNIMIDFFDKWCKDIGFSGIYIIEECAGISNGKLATIESNKSNSSELIYLTQPMIGKGVLDFSAPRLLRIFSRIIEKLNQKGLIKRIKQYDGDKIYQSYLEKFPIGDQFVPGAFFEWDNTPRHGNRGFIINPVTKDSFLTYMDSIRNYSMVIINAWNEWAEGMMMEPTKEYGFRYLEWVNEWKMKDLTKRNNHDG